MSDADIAAARLPLIFERLVSPTADAQHSGQFSCGQAYSVQDQSYALHHHSCQEANIFRAHLPLQALAQYSGSSSYDVRQVSQYAAGNGLAGYVQHTSAYISSDQELEFPCLQLQPHPQQGQSGQQLLHQLCDNIEQTIEETCNERNWMRFSGSMRLISALESVAAIQAATRRMRLTIGRAKHVALLKAYTVAVAFYVPIEGSSSGSISSGSTKFVVQAVQQLQSIGCDVEVVPLNADIENTHCRTGNVSDLLQAAALHADMTLEAAISEKVLERLVVEPATSDSLDKPVLVVLVMDRKTPGSATNLVQAISKAIEATKNNDYGSQALALSFVQVSPAEDLAQQLSEIQSLTRVNSDINAVVDFTRLCDVPLPGPGPITRNGLLLDCKSALSCKALLSAIDPGYRAVEDSCGWFGSVASKARVRAHTLVTTMASGMGKASTKRVVTLGLSLWLHLAGILG